MSQEAGKEELSLNDLLSLTDFIQEKEKEAERNEKLGEIEIKEEKDGSKSAPSKGDRGKRRKLIGEKEDGKKSGCVKCGGLEFEAKTEFEANCKKCGALNEYWDTKSLNKSTVINDIGKYKTNQSHIAGKLKGVQNVAGPLLSNDMILDIQKIYLNIQAKGILVRDSNFDAVIAVLHNYVAIKHSTYIDISALCKLWDIKKGKFTDARRMLEEKRIEEIAELSQETILYSIIDQALEELELNTKKYSKALAYIPTQIESAGYSAEFSCKVKAKGIALVYIVYTAETIYKDHGRAWKPHIFKEKFNITHETYIKYVEFIYTCIIAYPELKIKNIFEDLGIDVLKIKGVACQRNIKKSKT